MTGSNPAYFISLRSRHATEDQDALPAMSGMHFKESLTSSRIMQNQQICGSARSLLVLSGFIHNLTETVYSTVFSIFSI